MEAKRLIWRTALINDSVKRRRRRGVDGLDGDIFVSINFLTPSSPSGGWGSKKSTVAFQKEVEEGGERWISWIGFDWF